MSYSSTSTVPIEMLPGIGKRTAKVLRAWQIRTVGQFKQLPETVLIELFGPSIRPVYHAVHNLPSKQPFRIGQPIRTHQPVDRERVRRLSQPVQPLSVLSFAQKLKLATTVLSL